MKLPKHIALTIGHNENAIYYETVEGECTWRDADSHTPDGDGWVSLEERARAFATNELWECTWYPQTPVGSCTLRASTLDVLLAALAKIADEEEGA